MYIRFCCLFFYSSNKTFSFTFTSSNIVISKNRTSIKRRKKIKSVTYASVAFSLTVSTRPLASFSALFLFDSFDASDFFSSTLSFTASTPFKKNVI
jgi:hypothetical protein